MTKICGWEKSRLATDFFKCGFVGPVALIAGIILLALTYLDLKWVGSAAGGCALLVVVTMFFDYFFTPKPGNNVKAPNPWLRIPAGILSIFSASLWILDGWPT